MNDSGIVRDRPRRRRRAWKAVLAVTVVAGVLVAPMLPGLRRYLRIRRM